jgi:hypothetical protein
MCGVDELAEQQTVSPGVLLTELPYSGYRGRLRFNAPVSIELAIPRIEGEIVTGMRHDCRVLLGSLGN